MITFTQFFLDIDFFSFGKNNEIKKQTKPWKKDCVPANSGEMRRNLNIKVVIFSKQELITSAVGVLLTYCQLV